MVEFIYKYEAMLRLLAFLGGFSLLASWEWFNPRRKLSQLKSKRWLNNIALIISSTIIVRLLVPLAAIGAAYLVEQNQWGFANYFELPFWLKVLLTFILLDLSIYFQHIMFHVIPVMWRVHRVHHSDLDCDVSTGLRFHPVEIVVSIVIKIIVIMALGAPLLAVILFEIVLNLMSMFTHSNIYLNTTFEKVLRWFIVTPDMHRIHHSVLENETNSNFAFHISLWDRIFGTYMQQPKAGQEGMSVGLDQFREPSWQNFMDLIYMPFTTRVKGYAINYRDTKNADELALARQIALQNQEKAQLASELTSYIEAVGEHALVSVTDTSGKIVEVNKKFCEISGYSKEELLGQDHHIVNSGTHSKAFFNQMWTTIANGHNWRGEICNRNKQGNLYWVDSAIVPIKNAQGEVERYISVRLDITERKRREVELQQAYQDLATANDQLEQLSRIDALTNIANRRQFDETLLNEISKLGRFETPLTLIIGDIDYFKNYNDNYGHPAGDTCLQHVAQSIKSNFTRAGDLVARYGGEEFAIILSGVDKETALTLAERMRINIQKLNLAHASSAVARVVTISAGVTTIIPDKTTTAAMLIERADKALYMAKENGRNNVQYFE